MKTLYFFLILPFLLFLSKSYSQDLLISQPMINFDGKILLISYDLINKNLADKFYIWVEMQKKTGESIFMKSISGDIGDNVKTGKNKKISWIPANDSVFLNEEVFVEVKAEKYKKSFNKGSLMLLSTVIPGFGQTRISKGKPWWLIGVATYGTLAGGFIMHKNYIKVFNSYHTEEDPIKRADLFYQSQKQLNISNALIVTAASLWVANIFWVVLIPNKYQPLKYVKLAVDQSTGSNNRSPLLSLKLNF